ncbi:MAG: hypothetical protein LWW95_11855, partial [Candidatus Desulfofervidus auxilii]|nr:hypothetical protein [Candidatus Desulfofervidus auxilii]
MKKLTDLTYSKVTDKIFMCFFNIHSGVKPLQDLKIEFSPIEGAYLRFERYTPILQAGIIRDNCRYFSSFTTLGVLFKLIYCFFKEIVSDRWYEYSIYKKRKDIKLYFEPLEPPSKRIHVSLNYYTFYKNFLPLGTFFIALISLTRV